MERKAYNTLVKWLNDPYRKPLLIYGARQVGKTYLITKLFAPRHFKKVIYIDFKTNDKVRLFIKNHVDAKAIINYLSLSFNMDIDKNTLIVFDEIQECLPAITALKYFCQDYREVPIIATGSMVRIKLKQMNRKTIDQEIDADNQDGNNNYMFPVGKISELNLFPLTFDEYLMATNKKLYDFLSDSFEHSQVLDNSYHKLAMNSFFDYLLIGGMPEMVDIFIQTGSYQRSRQALQEVYNNYLNDMSLYQVSDVTMLRTRRLFDNIYQQLNKTNKNFMYSNVERGTSSREYLHPLDWLNESRLVYISYQTKEHVTTPLQALESQYRLYLPDTGLFALQSKINPASLIGNNQNVLLGIFYENYVATELKARGYPLFFWKGKTTSELEFLIELDDTIIPIDVKKNKGSMSSLDKYKEHNKCDVAVKVSQNKYGYDNQQNL
ncbi:MAG: AAA family ATPase, partial [Bacilli bacterium]|nr:AAA family ATPase [Bacilli bacterium]